MVKIPTAIKLLLQSSRETTAWGCLKACGMGGMRQRPLHCENITKPLMLLGYATNKFDQHPDGVTGLIEGFFYNLHETQLRTDWSKPYSCGKIAICRLFTFWKGWFSMAIFNYQRVNQSDSLSIRFDPALLYMSSCNSLLPLWFVENETHRSWIVIFPIILVNIAIPKLIINKS